MLLTGPGSGVRPAVCRSISATYQRTPSSARSTSAQASLHGLPISQTSSEASRSRCSVSASSAAVTRALRSGSATLAHERCASSAEPTAERATAEETRDSCVSVEPSTGVVTKEGEPASCHELEKRLRNRSTANASGATEAAREITSVQAFPGASRSDMQETMQDRLTK